MKGYDLFCFHHLSFHKLLIFPNVLQKFVLLILEAFYKLSSTFVYLYVCVWEGVTCPMACWRSEDTLQELAVFFHFVGPRD